jgi:hypothetical protein
VVDAALEEAAGRFLRLREGLVVEDPTTTLRTSLEQAEPQGRVRLAVTVSTLAATHQVVAAAAHQRLD